MKRIISMILIISSFILANDYNRIDKYESIKVGEDKYQVKIINNGDFTENKLFLNKENNDKINRNDCYYFQEDKGIFRFKGKGSIKCKDIDIEFVSKPIDEYIIHSIETGHLAGDLVIHFLPIVPFIIIIGTYLVYTMTGKKKVFWGMILALPFLYFLLNGNFYKDHYEDRKQEMYKVIGEGYYIDPRIL